MESNEVSIFIEKCWAIIYQKGEERQTSQNYIVTYLQNQSSFSTIKAILEEGQES